MKHSLYLLAAIVVISFSANSNAENMELWFGKVEYAQMRDALNQEGEPELVIEWLAQRYLPLEAVEFEMLSKTNNPLKATPIHNEYFVFTVRSQELPREIAAEVVEKANKNHPTVARIAEKQFVGTINGKEAMFIGGGNGGIYSNEIISK